MPWPQLFKGNVKRWIADHLILDGSDSFQKTIAINSNSPVFPYLATDDWEASILASYKHFYLSKFEYSENEQIDFLMLEDYLYTWGQVGIVKYANDFVMGKISVHKRDYNNKVTKFKLTPIASTSTESPQALKKIFTVGEDGVIITCGAGFWVGREQKFSPLFSIQQRITEMAKIYALIEDNAVLGRSILTVSVDTNEDAVRSMIQKLRALDPVINLGSAKRGYVPTDAGFNKVQDFKDRTNELIMTYNFIKEIVDTRIGMETNNNPDKREQQVTKEININNVQAQAINETELRYRQMGLKVLNSTFGLNVSVRLREQVPEEKGADDGGEQREQQQNTGT